MKAFKFFAMLIAAAAISFTATSCGDDDSVDDIIEDIQNGKVEKSADIKATSNTITLTMKMKNVVTITTVAKFDNNKRCTSCISTEVYATTALADDAWATTKDEKGVTRDGKTFTYDETEDYYGESYDEVKMEFEMMKQSFLTGRY